MNNFFIIGHRGARGEKFENSLSGFKYALTLDIDAIELDIRQHSGELWVIHDHELERLTGSTGRFDEAIDPSKLRLLNNEPIPRLREVLDLFWGKLPVNIEIKSFDTVSLLLELLDQYPVIEQDSNFPWILISSFDHRQIRELRNRSCPWELALLTGGIPINTRQLIDEIKPFSWNMKDEYVDYSFIEQIQRQGVRVMIYTVNKMHRAVSLRNGGIDGIFTDYPSSLANID
ncbi:MAG: glycerophosphodiester phosphodiesterase [Proteobacteria bacterium]|nr:glycerophosphodiester phosphodiesterase [Pseudomonadota bacterium]